MDSDEVIKRLEKVSRYFKSMLKVGYDGDADVYREHRESVKMAQELLKEQGAETEYVMDEYQPTCKACGFRPFVGYIPSLEWMKERGFKFCPRCGRAVKWGD